MAEHQKFQIENPLLKNQISSLQSLNDFYIQSDSLQNIKINLYKDQILVDEKQIKKLKSSKKKLTLGSSIGGIVLFILGLLL